MQSRLRLLSLLCFLLSFVPVVLTFGATLYAWPFEIVGQEEAIIIIGFASSFAFLMVGFLLIKPLLSSQRSGFVVLGQMFLVLILFGFVFFIILPFSFTMRSVILPRQCAQNTFATVNNEPTPHERVVHKVTPEAIKMLKRLPWDGILQRYKVAGAFPILIGNIRGVGKIEVYKEDVKGWPSPMVLLIHLEKGESCTVGLPTAPTDTIPSTSPSQKR